MNAKVFNGRKKHWFLQRSHIEPLTGIKRDRFSHQDCLGVWKVAHLALFLQPPAETYFLPHIWKATKTTPASGIAEVRVPSMTSQRADFSLLQSEVKDGLF